MKTLLARIIAIIFLIPFALLIVATLILNWQNVIGALVIIGLFILIDWAIKNSNW
jgi:hypothetical protein